MHKLLISIFILTNSMLIGCSTMDNLGDSFSSLGDALPDYASKMPLMYRPDIQQGNVIDQEMINKLKPGMSKRQVTYLLGTPGVVDSFHQNRWDYIYTLKKNNKDIEQRDLALYFEDDRLTKIEGDYRPMMTDEIAEANKKETVVDVPDYEPEGKGIITRTLEAVGITPTE